MLNIYSMEGECIYLQFKTNIELSVPESAFDKLSYCNLLIYLKPDVLKAYHMRVEDSCSGFRLL